MKTSVSGYTVTQIENHKNSIFKNKQLLYLWTGTSLSNLMFHIFTLALPIIIYDLTKSTLAMSTMRAIEFIPNILLGMLIGVLVDRINRKRILLVAVGLQIAMIGVLVILLLSSNIQLWHLYILGFVLYTSGYAFGNAYHTVVPSIAEKGQLTSVNATISFIKTFINIIGPAFAGFILLSMGYKFGLMLTIFGLTVLFFFVSLVHIPYDQPNKKSLKTGIWEELKEGWDQLISTKELWIATIMILVMNIASASSGAVLVFYALDVLTVTEGKLGFIFSSAAVGAILASSIAKRSRNWINRGSIFLGAISIAALGQFVNFLSTEWYWLSLGMFFIGFSVTLVNIHYFTLRQESTPNHLLGRVAGTSTMLMKLAMPISFISVGAVGEVVQVHYVFLGSSLILLSLIITIRRTLIRIN